MLFLSQETSTKLGQETLTKTFLLQKQLMMSRDDHG